MFVCILDASGNVRVHQNIQGPLGSNLQNSIITVSFRAAN
jgi:hypothetical protein